MSRILDQLKNARKDKKTPPPNYDSVSLETIIEHNTPRRSKGSNPRRLVIIFLSGVGLIFLAVFTATHLLTNKERPSHSRPQPAVQKAKALGMEGLASPHSAETGWQRPVSKELAAKKVEVLPLEVMSIESIDEGPVIEDVELKTVTHEKKPATPVDIKSVEPQPAPAPPGIETIEIPPFPVIPPNIDIEAIELAPIPVEIPEKAPAVSLGIEAVEPAPTPGELPEIETIELELIPVAGPEKVPAVTPEIETVEVVPAPSVPPEIEEIEIERIPVAEPKKIPAVSPEIEVVEFPPAPVGVPVTPPEEAPLVPVLPKVVEREKPETPRIEIKVAEPGVPEKRKALTAGEKAALAEAPPTLVMEQPAVGIEVPPIPVSPPVPPKKAEVSRIEIKTAPERAPGLVAKGPKIPTPPVEVVEEVPIEIQPPTVTEAPQPSAVTPPPAEPGEELVFEEGAPATPEVLKKRERFKRALFYQKSGELKRAQDQYLEIIKLDPLDPETHNNLGSIYQEWGDLDDAISEYRKAILLRPDYAKARNNLGVALYKKGNLQAALREFQIVVESNPRDIQSLTNIGVVSRKLGQPDRARQFFETTLSIDPSHAEAHYNLALILEPTEVSGAIYHYQKFLEYSGGRYPSLEEQVMRHLKSLSKKPWV